MPSPEDSPTEILASDLQKLMVVVEAAVALYNAFEGFDPGKYPWEQLIRPWSELGDALSALGLEES